MGRAVFKLESDVTYLNFYVPFETTELKGNSSNDNIYVCWLVAYVKLSVGQRVMSIVLRRSDILCIC